MLKLEVYWSDYYQKIEQLAVKIYKSGWEFNQTICLARGGLRAGDVFSGIYNKPLAILATSSCSGMGQQERKKLDFARHLTILFEH